MTHSSHVISVLIMGGFVLPILLFTLLFAFFLFLLIFSVLFVSKEVIKMMRTLLNEAQTGGLFVYFRGPPTGSYFLKEH